MFSNITSISREISLSTSASSEKKKRWGKNPTQTFKQANKQTKPSMIVLFEIYMAF